MSARAESGIALLLSLIPYVTASGSVTVTEAAAHFDVPESRIRQAVELLFMSGPPDGFGDFDRFDIDFDAFEQHGVIDIVRRPVLDTDTVRLSPREASALSAGLALIADYVDAPRERIAALQSRLRAAASAGAATVAVDERAANDTVRAVRDAIRARQPLVISYRKPGEGSVERTIAPLRIELRDSEAFLVAHDFDRAALRTFRLDRIEATRVVEAAWPATVAERERPRAATALTVRATPAAAAMLADYRTGAAEQDGEHVLLRIEVWNLDAVLRAVASCGGGAEIVAPATARAAMCDFAERALRAYR